MYTIPTPKVTNKGTNSKRLNQLAPVTQLVEHWSRDLNLVWSIKLIAFLVVPWHSWKITLLLLPRLKFSRFTVVSITYFLYHMASVRSSQCLTFRHQEPSAKWMGIIYLHIWHASQGVWLTFVISPWLFHPWSTFHQFSCKEKDNRKKRGYVFTLSHNFNINLVISHMIQCIAHLPFWLGINRLFFLMAFHLKERPQV